MYKLGNFCKYMLAFYEENGLLPVWDLSSCETFQKNAGKGRPYIQIVQLNNKPYNNTYIDHSTLISGGVLEFTMSEKSNKIFGQSPAAWPSSSSQ